MKMKKRLYAKKIGILSLAAALSVTSISGDVPALVQAAGTTVDVAKKVTIGVGENYQLTKGNIKNISFRSSNKKIVTVNQKGIIKGKKTGKATIVVKFKKNTKKCTVTVKKAPKAIKIQNGNLKLSVKSMKQLSVKFTDGYSNKVIFQSNNKAVATVTSKGLVRAVRKGTTTITATTLNNKKAKISCVVTDNRKDTVTATPVTTVTPSVVPVVTDSAIPTASAEVLPTDTASVTEEPSSKPVETAAVATEVPTETPIVTPSSVPTETPKVIPSEVPMETPKVTPSNVPTETPKVTPSHAPTEKPIVTASNAPTETPNVTPGKLPVPTTQASIVPSSTPIVDLPTRSAITQTASPEGVVTCSAVVSKIENGNIYVDDNTKILELAKCVHFYKNNCMITKNEILVGDTITITSSGYALDCFPTVLVDCEKIEVTKSDSRLVSQRTICGLDEMHIMVYDDYMSPLTYETSRTKIYKNGEEISFQDLKEGDAIRINYTYYGSDEKDGAAGFCEVLDTVVVLDEDTTNTRKASGVINSITASKSEYDEGYYYVEFGEGFYCAIADDNTVIKKKDDKKEFAVGKSALRVGQTIEVFYEDQSYDLVPTWLNRCKKIVIDTTVPLVTASVAPTLTPDVTASVAPTASTDPTPGPLPTPDPWPSIAPMKPVIYLYPEKETSVSADLDFHGTFTYTYPYTSDGHWDVVAKPDGTLINKADNQEYSYLFWEGVADNFTPDFSKGFCVKGEDTTEFLRKVLSRMGLTPKEYNEFIVYWAPQMQNNPYNLISFQTENYEEMAPLHINPAPDSMLRVYMAYKPLTAPVAVPEQTFAPFERKGFTVVEWGGCVINGDVK